MIGMLSVSVILVAVVGAIGYASWSYRRVQRWAKLIMRITRDVFAPGESSDDHVEFAGNARFEIRGGRVELLHTSTYEDVVGLLWR
jgi:hypothetical protein